MRETLPAPTTTLADRKDVDAFVASLPPDATRDHLADAYRDRADHLATLCARGHEIRTRLEEIAAALRDPGAQDRTALIAERGMLSTELHGLPDATAAAARHYAEALIAWAQGLYDQALVVRNVAADRISAGALDRIRLTRQLIEFERTAPNVATIPITYEAVQQERAALAAREAPLRHRRTEAEAVLSAITYTLRQHFDEDVYRATVPPERVEAFVARVCNGVTT